MSKRSTKEKRPGYGKLLDSWVAPPDAGDPIGCLATTFTFSSEFFEVECLSRFVRLESDPDEDGPLYLIEREEKLAQLVCAAVLVDQHHCKGIRSPRWDLLGIRPAAGLMHAKISLLQWDSRIRLIIASANLTEDGYRRNREIFGAIDYHDDGEEAPECLDAVVEYLHEVVSNAEGQDSHTPAIERCRTFLDGVIAASTRWGKSRTGRTSRSIKAVLTGPGRPSVLDSIGAVWPGSGRPDTADVVSPFFDPPDAPNDPVKELWRLLRQRGDASVNFHVLASEVLGEDSLLICAPKSIIDAQPRGRSSLQTSLHRLSDEPSRPLHAKSIWLEGDSWAGYMIGSSNFTSAGLGVGRRRNFEANLLYLVNHRRDSRLHAVMCDSFLPSEPIPTDMALRWHAPPNEDEEADASIALLPKAFGAAVFARRDDGQQLIRLVLADAPPGGWKLCANETDECFVDERAWVEAGAPDRFEVSWVATRPPPYGFTVFWSGTDVGAWWPVNIESSAVLPPPDELQDLPLEVLIDVLTSGRPLHKAMRRWLKRTRVSDAINGAEIDPHRRVDTSAFLLQRTRRVSSALRALRERLERPVSTRESLHWRLQGPVGVRSLANAIVKEAKSDEERSFLLAELGLELARVRPAPSASGIPPAVVKQAIAQIVRDLLVQLDVTALRAKNLRQYIGSVLEKVGVAP